ncbi:hypothetical protein NDU88_006820 [Pleurodeles waltl]|uniref:Uncharacterized protein n=1 Tax=Pleurodeles waltl TaxID=8319 RepID=A0AAV7VSM1_PLEWA|nr:hypothetical protein NDU88_006820 [Pleurodeles waltl]
MPKHCLGAGGWRILKHLPLDGEEEDELDEFEVIVRKLDINYGKNRNGVEERYKFLKRRQKLGEMIDDFMPDLP